MPEPALQEAVPSLTALQLLATPGAVVVDLRSPSEFADDHVPGALNAPLFDDVERAVIGTLYKRTSPGAAFEEGRRAARANIGGLLRTIARAADWKLPATELESLLDEVTSGGIAALESSLQVVPVPEPGERPVVLHCWRGGLRSRSVAAFVRLLGLERAVGLEGGYKSYRRAVREGLARWQAPPTFVIRGLTGVGKTLVLRELERIRPGWTLDLEGLAGHRSSILGMVGLAPCSQKTFESRLFTWQREHADPERVVMEGESRKVGDAIVPEAYWHALDHGVNIELTAPVERRVDVLIEDYLASAESRAELRAQLPFIERRLGPVRWKDRLVALLDTGRERELVELLLERYYDPLYRHSAGERRIAGTVDATRVVAAAEEVAGLIESATPG